MPPAEVKARMESPDRRHTKTADGTVLLCLNSMLKRVRRTKEGDSAFSFRLISCCNGKIELTQRRNHELSNAAKAMIIVAVFVLALTAVPAAKAADRGCSNATLKGPYSDQDTGTIVGVGPFAGVNVDSIDGNGKITISGWSSLNGSVSYGVLIGTYMVNADCTATYTVTGGATTVDGFFVISGDGNKLQIVITDPGTVIN